MANIQRSQDGASVKPQETIGSNKNAERLSCKRACAARTSGASPQQSSGVDGVDVSEEIHKKHGKDMQQHGLNQ